MSQHDGLTLERWRGFQPEQRLLMIANEMHRASKSIAAGEERSRRLGYQRVLRLVGLTAEAADRLALRRELLRWRDLVAALYIGEPDAARHAEVFRALLLLSPAGAAQLRALKL